MSKSIGCGTYLDPSADALKSRRAGISRSRKPSWLLSKQKLKKRRNVLSKLLGNASWRTLRRVIWGYRPSRRTPPQRPVLLYRQRQIPVGHPLSHAYSRRINHSAQLVERNESSNLTPPRWNVGLVKLRRMPFCSSRRNRPRPYGLNSPISGCRLSLQPTPPRDHRGR